MEMYFHEFNTIPGFKAYKSYANFILVRIPAEIKDKLQNYSNRKWRDNQIYGRRRIEQSYKNNYRQTRAEPSADGFN